MDLQQAKELFDKQGYVAWPGFMTSDEIGQVNDALDRYIREIFPTLDEMKSLVSDPWAYVYEHLDGVRCSVIAVNGLVGDFNFAAHVDGHERPMSTNLYLPMPSKPGTLASFFTPLGHHAEEMFRTGLAPYPIERTLLTTGLTEAGVDSLHQDGARIDTPHLHIAYTPAPKSTFWQS